MMGAEAFTTHAEGKTASEAFDKAVADAQYYHGRGGYTGTIAEKDGYVVFPLPEGMDADTFERVVCDYLYGDSSEPAPGRIPGIQRIAEVYDDKWGPAVCVQTGPTSWCFMGYASS